MSRYVIQRLDGLFVTPPGRPRSYTRKVQYAVTFCTLADAARQLCPQNERVRAVSDILQTPGA